MLFSANSYLTWGSHSKCILVAIMASYLSTYWAETVWHSILSEFWEVVAWNPNILYSPIGVRNNSLYEYRKVNRNGLK